MRILNIPTRPPAWPIWACTLGVVLVVTALDIQVARAESALNPTPVSQGQLDRAAFAEWFAGHESPIPVERAKNGPRDVLWTQEQRQDWPGIHFGLGREPGVRHLRIGFTEPIALGTVLARCGGRLSVLKPDATYPGDLGDDSQWLSAERLSSRRSASLEDFEVWSLPPGTKARALRFTHVAEASDTNPAGWLGGAWVLGERVTNVAPQATVVASAREERSTLLNDQLNNGLWGAWDNGEQGAALPISAEHPEIITLSWPRSVKLSGVCLIWAGFSAAELLVLEGPDTLIPKTAPESAWHRVAQLNQIDSLYPLALSPHWLDFGRTVETRALRLRITAPIPLPVKHSHLEGKTCEGRRVWLGEFMALAPLGNGPLSSAELPRGGDDQPPPIAVKFHLPAAGVATLVIEDSEGRRVRNLVSETPYPAGDNVAWWDGSDDLLRDDDAARHGLYHIPARFVSPGKYTVRGLWRKPLGLRFEQSVYSAGHPAWETADKTGCWMTNHTPPTSVACLPGSRTKDGQPLVFMGAFVSEGGHGLQWIREDGTKVGGQGWIGGNWTGAPTLAVDLGPKAIGEHLCYVASTFEGELRVTAKSTDFADRPILKRQLGDDPAPDKYPDAKDRPTGLPFDNGDHRFVLAGIAARDGLIVCSLVRQNELLFVDARSGEIARKAAVDNPRGVAFDSEGRLLVLSGTKLLRFASPEGAAETIPLSGLEDPRHVALDAAGNFYITDRGHSHQVKVFSPAGKPLRAIGKGGEPATGDYEPLHMNSPNGLAIDSQGRGWVAEDDYHPKRVSLWSAEGELLRGFYGPGEYGGGGVLDSRDKTRFFYKGLEFRLDWQQGTDKLVRVYYRPSDLLAADFGPFSPDTPLYPPARSGERYFTSCYTHIPTNGDGASFVWHDEGSQVRLVAGLGSAHAWPLLKNEPFRALWPEGVNPLGDRYQNAAAFSWSDRDGDGRPQPAEVKIVKGNCSGVTVMPDLSFVCARFDDKTVAFTPTGYNEYGAPQYKIDAPRVLAEGANGAVSSGGEQALTEPEGWTIHTNAPKPFSASGLGGTFRGQPRWSYPSVWPGLHASHESAVPDRPGMLVGTTRLLGGWIQPRGDAGPLFGINGNMGNMYLMTADGLFVATLFHDIRLRPNWAMPTAVRGMDVSNVSLHDENFWPSLTQTADGEIFVVDGARVSLVRVEGLDSIQRIPASPLEVTTADLGRAREWFSQAEARRRAQQGSDSLEVVLRASPPQVDGKLDDWPAVVQWATIDRRGTAANFDSHSRPYNAAAAATISGDRLYAAWRTTEKELFRNSGDTPDALFKTGGCLDLMLGTDSAAKADRGEPVAGDLRLLVTLVKEKPRAVLYRARVPGAKQPVGFSSPWRTITFDSVEDITDSVMLAADGQGNFELSVPLARLGWQPKAGASYRADLGLLRGDGHQTTQRVYWSNKATAITADVPSEAELTPRLWGLWQVVPEKP
jgi:hypothetical protein